MDQDTALRIANALEFFVGVHPEYVPTPGKPPLPSSPQAKKILADKLKAEADAQALIDKAEAEAKAIKAKADADEAAAKAAALKAESDKAAAASKPTAPAGFAPHGATGGESGKK